MLLPRIEVTVKQNSLNRNQIIRINYVNDFNYEESMAKFISEGTIMLPNSRLYVNLSTSYKLYENIEELEKLPTVDIGASDFNNNLLYNLISDYDPNNIYRNKQPMFRIGDFVNVRCTYLDPITNNLAKDKDIYYQDFVITNLSLKDKIEIKFSNLTWFFKQMPFEEKVIKAGTNFNNIIKKYINLLNATILNPKGLNMKYFLSDDVNFNGQIVISGNMSFAQFLDKIKTDYGITTYMAYGVLVFGRISTSITEIPIDKNFDERIFTVQTNVIDMNNLEFKNKDGLKLSAIVSNTFTTSNGETTKDGHAKNKKVKMSVYIEFNKKNQDILNNVQSNIIKEKNLAKLLDGVIILNDNNGNKVGEVPRLGNEKGDGERRTFVDMTAKNTNDLIVFGLAQLQKFYYDGMRGDFETFGQPTTFVTDTIRFEDLEHPEKNGFYRVKGVKTSFGMDGYRQNITLDIKIKE